MSREILFRGKRIDNGEWVYGFLVKSESAFNSNQNCIINLENHFQLSSTKNGNLCYSESDTRVHEVIPESVGQYIGLTDKNGKNVFEGDILLTDTIPQFVKFNKYLACWGVAQSENSSTMSFDKSWSIIGNIHDNPEMIGKEATNG